MTSNTRVLSEKIQEQTGLSLVYIIWQANQYVASGLCKTVEDALIYMVAL